MKIRVGFVSNSSSSSFVVLLPENFIKNIDFDKIEDIDDEFPLDAFKELLERLIDDDGLHDEDVYSANRVDNNYHFQDVLYDIIKPYIIASMDSGSDDGKIIVADKEKIKKLLI